MEKYIIEPAHRMSLLDALKNEGIVITADCGGKGTCGKCKVSVGGKRCLACKTIIEEKVEVEIPKESRLDSIYIEKIEERTTNSEKQKDTGINAKSLFMAVDIGTTTVAGVVCNSEGKIIASAGCINSQRICGADVVSRIESSGKGELKRLKALIRRDILSLKEELSAKAHVKPEDIKKVIISANTVMEHLFMGYDLSGFEKAPYKAVTLDAITDAEYELLPGISPFVGADILSGISYCEIDKSEGYVALIDLGTNGEMAVGNKNRIFVSSTAAGPVFEGGALSCGMTAMAGAIADIEISGMRVFTRTINDVEPKGICGSGIVAAVSELKRNRIIDKNGILSEDFIEDGFSITSDVYITKDDIRSFLMAKAAIAAGFECICAELGLRSDDIEKLYIAGGFGKHLNIDKAIETGLIPAELRERCVIVGNTSLKGALLRAEGSLSDQRLEHIKGLCKEIVLADSEYFKSRYIQNMLF